MIDLKHKLSELVIFSKYANYRSELQRRENWNEIVERNLNMHLSTLDRMYQEKQITQSVRLKYRKELDEAYYLVKNKELLPSMRSMQFAGKAIEQNNARLYNCSFLQMNTPEAFGEIMFLLLSGTGVGFSIQYCHVNQLPSIKCPKGNRIKFVVPDTIEGWADAVKKLMYSYFLGSNPVDFDFSRIRGKGAPLSSGGKAPGSEPLEECLLFINRKLHSISLNNASYNRLAPIDVHDIVCNIGRAVLSGGIRRSALISLFSENDEDMLMSKATDNWWQLHPYRTQANNSVVMYRDRPNPYLIGRILFDINAKAGSGEPGIFWTNGSEYGTNPCAEIGLHNMQFCNLTTINAAYFSNKAIVAATIIGGMQSLYTDFKYLRHGWKDQTESERLLGISITGLGQQSDYFFKAQSNLALHVDNEFASDFNVPKSARITTIKPEGTSSLVLGTTSGIHAAHSQHYIRNMRFNKNEAIVNYLTEHCPGIVQDDVTNPGGAVVVGIPIQMNAKAYRNEPIEVMFDRMSKINEYWIKPGHRRGNVYHNCSATVTYKNKEDLEIIYDKMCKQEFQAISVLPYSTDVYAQAPFEEIDVEKYRFLIDSIGEEIRKLNFEDVKEYEDDTNLAGELACAGGVCEIL